MILWHCARRAFAGVAAAFLLTCGGLLDEAGAKPIKMQFQDVKIDYKADKAGTMATSIDLVVQNADSGKALSKFQIQVSAPVQPWGTATARGSSPATSRTARR